MPKSVLSLILGGGRGTRLHPLTDSRSKPAVPIAGKYRLVDIPISNCLNSGMNRIYVLTQFNSASLNRHIKNTYAFDVFRKGFVDILAAEQTVNSLDWYQGTADAVRQSFHHFQEDDYEYILILSGDQLYHLDFREMLAFHKESGADVSIATIPVNAQDATGFGIMKTDENKTITSFVEKPTSDLLAGWESETGDCMQKQGRNYLASMGIYLFSKKAITDLLVNSKGTDFGSNIIPEALEKYKVSSFQYNDYWEDIGTIKAFFEANLDLASDIPQFNLYHNHKEIYTHARMLPPAKVVGTTLEKTVLSDGCIIHASRLENCVVGIRTRIGKGSTISNCYMMGSDNYETLREIEEFSQKNIPPMGVGERCFINNAILDKNVRIGNDVRINGGSHIEDHETDAYCVVEGIVVVKKGAVLPNGFSL